MKMNLIKQKDFRLLITAKFISLVGTQMQSFALSLYVLKVTGSAVQFASVLAITYIPILLLTPIAGVLVDWLNRKKMLLYLDLCSAAIVTIFIAVFIKNNGFSILDVYVFALLLTLVSILYNPASSTVIPSIVKRDELVDANAINTLSLNIGNLAAPALAGVLLGLSGMLIILIINSLSYLVSFICEIFINIPVTNRKPEKISIELFAKDLSEGIVFIKNKQFLLNIIMLAVVVNFVCSPIELIGVTYICKKVIKASDYQYGVLSSIITIALMVSPFICSSINRKFRLGKIIFWDLFSIAVLVALMAIVASPKFLGSFSTNTIPYICIIVIMFMMYLISSISNISLNSMFQKEVPLSLMGRVGTVMGTLFMVSIPIGQMIFGIALDRFQAWTCIALSAIILASVILIFRKSLNSSGNLENKKQSEIVNNEVSFVSAECACVIEDENP